MKPSPLLIVCGMFIAWAAWAQEPILVCQRTADGACVWVEESEAYYERPPVDAPVVPDPAPPVDVPVEIWFDWRVAPLEQDPLMGRLGVCAFTPGRARYRFALAMHAASQTKDFNKVIETYDWRGKTTAEADVIIARLESLPTSGAWEQSVIVGWMGEGAAPPPSSAAKHWRWVGGDQVVYFDMKKTDDCWFVSFGNEPSKAPPVVPSKQTESIPPLEPEQSEPGVYQF